MSLLTLFVCIFFLCLWNIKLQLGWILRQISPHGISANGILEKNLHIGKLTVLRRATITFSQNTNEQLHESWERFKELLGSCPHYDVPIWQLVQSFILASMSTIVRWLMHLVVVVSCIKLSKKLGNCSNIYVKINTHMLLSHILICLANWEVKGGLCSFTFN